MRVVAISSMDEKSINIFGYGEMVGKEPCPWFHDLPFPKIILDNGEIIWGCECWWCSEESFNKEQIRDRQINIVPIKRMEQKENISGGDL